VGRGQCTVTGTPGFRFGRLAVGSPGRPSIQLDLNLLIPLAVLLEERNVSSAAARLRVSQPTASGFLAKLRRHFDDPLLIREGNAYLLSALATRLRDELPAALHGVERIASAQLEFRPVESTREFRILTTDYATSQVGRRLLARLAGTAPGVRLRFDQILTSHVDEAPDSLRDVDGMFLPHGYLSQQPHLDVLVDDWACLVAVDNPALSDIPTADELLSSPWITTIWGPGALTPAARQLQIAGLHPLVSTITPHFFVIPSLVDGSNRIALLPRRLAEDAVRTSAGLRIVPPPILLSPISEAFWWHRDREYDPAHRWLREQLTVACAPLLPPERA
jgi:DNA-binding transcriptional LysR family regulator